MLCRSRCAVVLQDMEPSEIGSILRHPAMGRTVQDCLHSFPALSLEAQLQPITRCALSMLSPVPPRMVHLVCHAQEFQVSTMLVQLGVQN